MANDSPLPQPIAVTAQNAPYDVTQSQHYGDLINAYNTGIQTPWAWNPTDANRQGYTQQVNQIAGQFASQFQNNVGRAPTSAETDQFIQNFVIPNTNNIGNGTNNSAFIGNMPNQINQFIGQNFQQAANQYAQQQLTSQQDQYNQLAQTSLNQGNTAINNVQQSLLDYQQQLFDRLRPQLLTSLQSQGLLDTGGMNEAIAGVQGDLANNASQYIAQLQLANQQQANQISLTGASNPIQQATSQYQNQPSFLNAMGNNSTAFNNQTFTQQLGYNDQLGLIKAQRDATSSLQPSFLRTMGQGFAGGFGTTSGNNMANMFNPNQGQNYSTMLGAM